MQWLETNLNGLFLLRLGGERNLFGLAPGGVYLAAPIAQGTGELLPHLFTLIPTFAGTVCFLWHFPYPRPVEPGTVRVTDHPTLWSSDFPLLLIARLYPVSEGATICSPSTPLLSFFPCHPRLNRPVRQTICCPCRIPRGGLTMCGPTGKPQGVSMTYPPTPRLRRVIRQ